MSGRRLTLEDRQKGHLALAARRADIRVRSEKMSMARDSLILSERRGDDELRNAQLVIAGVANDHPGLGCVEAREAELEEVLQMLGLLRRI